MKHCLSIIILWIFLTLTGSLVAAFEISDSEKAWLASHPQITVGLPVNAPPHSTIGENGELVGFDLDIVKYLNYLLSG